jgi:hypothetical protein
MQRSFCLGNKTEKSARITALLLTLTQTFRMQGTDPIEFLAEAIRSHRERLPAPWLLPNNRDQLREAASTHWTDTVTYVLQSEPMLHLSIQLLDISAWKRQNKRTRDSRRLSC